MADTLHQPLIIVGTHRSGTSMLTRTLIAGGIFFGQRRLPVEEEALHFLRLNQWLLAMAGTDWDWPLAAAEAFSAREDIALLSRTVRNRLHGPATLGFLGPRFLAARGDLREGLPFGWGFKDPRSSLTLPLWLAIYPGAKVLRIRRHGVPVAASLTKRFGVTRARRGGHPQALARLGLTLPKRLRSIGAVRCRTLDGALAIWDEYERVLDHWLAQVPGEQALTLHFEELVADPAAGLGAIGDWLGRPELATLAGSAGLDDARAESWRDDPLLAEFARNQAAILVAHGYPA